MDIETQKQINAAKELIDSIAGNWMIRTDEAMSALLEIKSYADEVGTSLSGRQEV